MFEFKTKVLDIESTGKMEVIMHVEDAESLSIHGGDRVLVKGETEFVAILNTTNSLVEKGEVGFFKELEAKGQKFGDSVTVQPISPPKSIDHIKKRLFGSYLSGKEIQSVVEDLVDGKLTDTEIAYFISTAYVHELDMEETVALTKATINTGNVMDLKVPTIDKHCIGGVPGNRTSPLVVPIVCAAGLVMPKLSSRAITSPAGTADTMEVLANVTYPISEVERIVKETGGCLIWGGGVNIAPADDILSSARYSLRLDPTSFLLSSIMAKKKAVGSDKVLIDIPMGKGAKYETVESARKLADKFVELGRRLDMTVEVVLTPGDHPIGKGIGPALEARDILEILNGSGPADLREKAISISGAILELGGKATEGNGHVLARELLESGKALKKMKEILAAQEGNPDIKPEDVPLGQHQHLVTAERDGKVYGFDNHGIVSVCRAAGAPKSKGAGCELLVSRGSVVKKGDPIINVVSESEAKLTRALEKYEKHQPIEMERTILGIIERR